MSKPTYSPVFVSSDDCGGYFGAVETVIVPLSQIWASRSPHASGPPPTPPAADDPPEPDEPVSALPQAASGRARRAASATRPRVLCMFSPQIWGVRQSVRAGRIPRIGEQGNDRDEELTGRCYRPQPNSSPWASLH